MLGDANAVRLPMQQFFARIGSPSRQRAPPHHTTWHTRAYTWLALCVLLIPQAEREMEKAAKHVERAFEHEARSAEKEFEGKGDTAMFGSKKHAKQNPSTAATGANAQRTTVAAPAAGATTSTATTRPAGAAGGARL